MTPIARVDDVTVRVASVHDVPGILPLLAPLGYPTDPAALRRRMDAIADSPTDTVFVAITATETCGVVAAHIGPLFALDGSYVRITALAVAEHARGNGVGRRLVRAVESFGVEHGCRWVELTSGRRPEREAAHQFYPALGYQDTGHVRYRRPLGDATR